MNQERKAAALAAIERAEKLNKALENLPYVFRTEKVHLDVEKMHPILVGLLKEALAENERLEEQLKEAQHKPIGQAHLVNFPNVHAAAGITQFMNNQPQDYIWCSCGKIYPKDAEHTHKFREVEE